MMATNARSITGSSIDTPGSSPWSSGNREHALHLYENAESLSRTVAEFVSGGLAKGQPGLVIATTEHLAGITQELEVRQIDWKAMQKDRRLVTVAADEMLRRIAPAELDAELCLRVLGDLVSELAASAETTVVAYGEMVDLLWQSGKQQAAIRLERIWNELLNQHPIRLLCGYSAKTFGAEDHVLLDGVCTEHSMCLPSAAYLGSGERARLKQVLYWNNAPVSWKRR